MEEFSWTGRETSFPESIRKTAMWWDVGMKSLSMAYQRALKYRRSFTAILETSRHSKENQTYKKFKAPQILKPGEV